MRGRCRSFDATERSKEEEISSMSSLSTSKRHQTRRGKSEGLFRAMCCLTAWISSSLFRFGSVTTTFNTRGANLSSASTGVRLWMYPSLNSLSGLPKHDSHLLDIQSEPFTGHSSIHARLQMIKLNLVEHLVPHMSVRSPLDTDI